MRIPSHILYANHYAYCVVIINHETRRTDFIRHAYSYFVTLIVYS